MTLNAKIGIFYGFFEQFRTATQSHSQGGATVLELVAWRRW